MSFYDQDTGSWSEKIFVGGSDGMNPSLAAISAVQGLWLFSLILVAVWSAVTSGRKHGSTQPTANLCIFWIALSIAILHYTFSFTNAMIEEQGAWTRASYLVVDLIFNYSFGILGGICLLATIHYLIFRLHQQARNTYDNDKRTLLWAHYGFCGILALFYLAMFGLQMHDLYDSIFHPDTDPFPVEYKGIPDINIIFVTYNALYLCAALEILAASFWLLKQSVQMHTCKTPGLLLLGLVSMPLLVRSTFELGLSISNYIILDDLNDSIGLFIALSLIDGLCWLLVFIGIFLISNQDSSSLMPTPFDIESRQVVTDGVLNADKSGSSSS